MRKYLVWCVVALLAAAPVRADQKPPRLVEDTWDAAYLEGAKTGYYHTTVHELRRDGQKVLRTTMAMHLTVKRYDAVVALRLETTTDETPSGRVLALSLTQYLDKGRVVQSA